MTRVLVVIGYNFAPFVLLAAMNPTAATMVDLVIWHGVPLCDQEIGSIGFSEINNMDGIYARKKSYPKRLNLLQPAWPKK